MQVITDIRIYKFTILNAAMLLRFHGGNKHIFIDRINLSVFIQIGQRMTGSLYGFKEVLIMFVTLAIGIKRKGKLLIKPLKRA